MAISPICEVTNTSYKWTRSDEEKAQTFAKHLAQVFTSNTNVRDDDVEPHLSSVPAIIPEIILFSLKEIQPKNNNLNIRKAQDLTVSHKKLSRKDLVLLIYILNAKLRLKYWPNKLNLTEIILILELRKDPNKPESYRSISLLPTTAKLLERLLLYKRNIDPHTEDWIAMYQFRFWEQHSTIHQTHRVSHLTNQSIERKGYCTSIFLDISQAFDKVWHRGLLLKIMKLLQITYFDLLKSYLSNRQFKVRVDEARSNLFPILPGVHSSDGNTKHICRWYCNSPVTWRFSHSFNKVI